jgi:iron complex outermembrane receptor protein
VPVRAEEEEKSKGEVTDFESIDDFGEFDLEALADVVFTASKHEQDIADSPSAITVITRDQIDNTHCTDVACLLRMVPEVDVIRVKPMWSAVGARAFTDFFENRTLVLIDGREINDELFGLVFWQALPIHLDQIERIEIIRGPGSSLYGANAHSMVVSIFTRKIGENTVEAFFGSGEHNRDSIHLGMGQQFGEWSLSLSAGLENADHWRVRGLQQREVRRLRLNLSSEGDLGITTVRAGLASVDGGIHYVLGPVNLRDATFADVAVSHETDFIRGQVSFSLLKGVLPITEEWERATISFEELHLGDIAGKIPFTNTNLDAEVQLTFKPFEGNLLIVGGNYRWIQGQSDETAPGEMNQHRIGVFVHDEQRLFKQLILTGGIRLDYNNLTPFTASPRIAAVWRFAEDQRLRLAFGMAFRKPSFMNSSVHLRNIYPQPAFPEFETFFREAIGNEKLKNESITTVEAGYHGRFLESRLTLEATAFYNRYRDTINFYIDMATNPMGVPDLLRSVARYENKGREVDSLGGSFSATFRVKRILLVGLNITYRHSFYISDPIGMIEAGAGEEGDRVSWEPALMGNLFCHYLAESGLRLGMSLHADSEREGFISTGGAFDRRVIVPEPARFFVSGFAAWRFEADPGHVEVGLRAFNFLQIPFRDLPGDAYAAEGELGGEVLGRRIFLFVRGAI